MQEEIDKKRVSGGVTRVLHKSRRVYQGVIGHADIAANGPMKADSIFHIASMAKPIMATSGHSTHCSGAIPSRIPFVCP